MAIRNYSSCIIQAQWEWNTSDVAGRWGTAFEAYRPRQLFVADGDGDSLTAGYSVITTRNKIRGKGRAISFKFSTQPGKDCQILGWNMEIRGNQEP